MASSKAIEEKDRESGVANTKLLWLFMVMKYLFAVGFTLLSYTTTFSRRYTVVCLLELGIIAFTSNWLIKRNKLLGRAFNTITMLLYILQIAILYFGNSFLSQVMVSNLEFLGGISGNAVAYIGVGVAIVVLSLLPIPSFSLPFEISDTGAISLLLLGELIVTMIVGGAYSPTHAYVNLASELVDSATRRTRIREMEIDSELLLQDFVPNSRLRPDSLPEQPNIVVFFAEGLSQSVIDDERTIMPNVREYQSRSLTFNSYFNHTSPTLRGLMGQLYSGYHNDNHDPNNLVSLQSILSGMGYHTAFLNTEPRDIEFSRYCETLGFNEVIRDLDHEYHGYNWGVAGSLSDRETFSVMFDKMEEYAATGQPFFLSTYTFGTHATFESTDEVFGDGSIAELNKFYNLDVWFGEFMRRFEESDLYDNTIIIFTTDHATYGDKEFVEAFPEYQRGHYFLDEIPLFFYYKGVESEVVEANGRNSLDFAPTVLDFLDMTAPNYFLGQSLFNDEDVSVFDTYYTEPGTYMSSENATIRELTGDELAWFEDKLMEYFAISVGGPQQQAA